MFTVSPAPYERGFHVYLEAAECAESLRSSREAVLLSMPGIVLILGCRDPNGTSLEAQFSLGLTSAISTQNAGTQSKAGTMAHLSELKKNVG